MRGKHRKKPEMEIPKINTSTNSFANKGDKRMTCRKMSFVPTLTAIAMKHHRKSIFSGKEHRVVSLCLLQNKTTQNILDLVWGNKYFCGYDTSENENLSKAHTKQRSLEQPLTYRKSGIVLASARATFKNWRLSRPW